MIFEQLLIYATIPLTSVFIRLSLEKLGLNKTLQDSKFKILNNLGYCALCFYTWCNLLTALVYSIALEDYTFLYFTPAFVVISLVINIKFEYE